MEKFVFILGMLLMCHVIENSLGCGKCPKRKKPSTPESRACDGNLPCYDYIINIIQDGPSTLVPATTEADLRRHYGLISRDGRRMAISEGRRAIAHYKNKYGFDFSYLSDTEVISRRTTGAQGIVFTPFTGDTKGRNRVYSVTVGNKVQIINRSLYTGGWVLTITQDTFAGGTYQKTIPAGAGIVFGVWIWSVCEDVNSYTPCENILNPDDPYSPNYTFFEDVDYFAPFVQPNIFFATQNKLYSPQFGSGTSRGYFAKRNENDPDDNVLDGQMTLFYPSYK